MNDVIVIGAGIIGTTLARELSKYELDVLVIEKENDVATKATMANSAIVHSGHDPLPGTLKAKFNYEGNKMYEKMCKDLDVPFSKCGGLVLANSQEDYKMLLTLLERGQINGLSKEEIKIIGREEIVKREPNIGDDVIAALDLPTTAVTFPWEVAYANMENAMDNGVNLVLNETVETITYNNFFEVKTQNNLYQSKVVINATGVSSDKVNNLFQEPNHEIKVRRGEYYVLDKNHFEVNSVLYRVPSDKGKGVIITPQYHGNVLIGPTSEFVDMNDMDKTKYSGLDYIKKEAIKSVKNVPYQKVIRTFAGGRATSNTKDFVINDCSKKGFINVGGIESPGLTAAPAIAKYVVESFVSSYVSLNPNTTYNQYRRKVIRLHELSKKDKNDLVKKDKRFGKIVCRCEQITEGEIIDSINRNCGATTIVGVKNRVRPGAGRCQGGFCQSEVLKILANERKIAKTEIDYNKKGSNILKFRTKGEQYE